MTDFLYGSVDFSHVYTCSQPIKVLRKQPEPFTTSTLQQAASNELHYSPKETMKICQQLYESGYITYMRTDSKTYSKEFIDSTKEYISRNYEQKYINETIDIMITGAVKEIVPKKKTKNNLIKDIKDIDSLRQEAHEAIRPTNISLKDLPETEGSKERRMYKLIWENTLESCMAPASFYSIVAKISGFDNTTFTYTSEQIDFPGWKIVSKKYIHEINPDNKEYHYLQTIKQHSIMSYKKMFSKVTMKGLKQHYTEARLVQLLEEKGIGRPSTFSMLVDKIQERGYVKKEDIKGKQIICNDYELENGDISEIETKREFGNEKGKLVIQQLGVVVMEFLNKHFNELLNYDYTRQMEDDLDKISKGNKDWVELCKDCNNHVDRLIGSLKDETKMEIKIDDNNTYVIGKFGPVIKCSEIKDGKEEVSFKAIKKDIDIHKIEQGEYNLEEIVDTAKTKKEQYILGQYDGHDVILRKGKFGLYVSWGENSKTLKELGNRPLESITFDDISKYLEGGSGIIREISSNISNRKGAKGDYIFYKTSKMKKPQFFDLKKFYHVTEENYKICNITILKSWMKDTYNIF